jgi:hypothetical protein
MNRAMRLRLRTSLFSMRGLLKISTLKNLRTLNATIVISLVISRMSARCPTKEKREILKDLNLECQTHFSLLAKI